jgi:hypothetical protein
MPPVHRSELSWPSIAALGTGVLALSYFVPVIGAPILGLIALIAIVSAVLARQDARRLAALSLSRAGEDIGSFARPFRHENVDMWVVRAVWDALGPWTTTSAGRVAVRPDDLLVEEMNIDVEDLGDVIAEIARRTGRSLDDLAANPYYESLRTVRDLVHFVNAQPR